MFSQELLNSFKEKITNASTIAIFGHESVDGDAIGSMLWLGKVCENLGETVEYFTTLPPSSSYDFLPSIDKIKTNFDYSDKRDLIIFVDFTVYSRIKKLTEGHESYFDSKDKLIIDHHLGDENPANSIVLKDVDAASCTELLYEICKETFPEHIDADIATYRYMGIMTDTGNFQYEQDTVRTMSNAIALIKIGAKKAWLIEYIFNNSKRSAIDLLKMTTPRITRTDNVCYARYTVQEIEDLWFDKDEADIMILNNIKPIRGVGVFAIIRLGTTGEVGISLRSGYLSDGKRINVQQIATQMNWGGHIYAAGARQPAQGDFETQVKKIVDDINTEIDKQL